MKTFEHIIFWVLIGIVWLSWALRFALRLLKKKPKTETYEPHAGKTLGL